MSKLEDIVSLCKRRGFIFPGSDIYGGMAGTWDFGPLGVILKRNIMDQWWKFFVENHDNVYGIDAAILMNPRTWIASGHTATFSDPLIECKECKSRFRADKIADGINESVTTEEFLATHTKCPVCGKENWGPIRKFNMMFSTHVGAVLPDDDKDLTEKSTAYLRPETAQGIFTNYKNVVDTFYPNLPFGLAQQGKAFRNEISPRDFILRDRECSQMEIEFFVHPDTWEENFEQIRKANHDFLENVMNLPKDKVHELEVPAKDRAHYSKRTIDYMFDYPNGQEELMGLAYRTDFDLKNIERESGKSMEYRDKNTGESFVPHVIEPSIGVERLFLAVLSAAYTEDEIDGNKRIVLKLPENLAPYKYCVSPLLKNKPELVEKAQKVYQILRKKYNNVTWDDSGNIGKRYRKQDEIGTPKCIVIDFDTLENDTVTVRDRDTTDQVRINISDL
ncbi:glycine--tRNA ligase [Candidatus Saccharibacteria bacterium]|nr:glycine--tRNA ligase [Candidatus Saccharibacteria bacterium]MBQ3476261.1 glycine--tRNA ligase [Candidatus Saccharibacteria bacterium]